MKRILLIIWMLFVVNGIFGQSIKFSTTTWDFGTIAEDGGEVSHTFEFVNYSKSPVVITSVRTSCGCTSTQYSRKPIAAGERSTFEVTYDPLYRPGTFSRNISIYTSGAKEAVVVTITGNVTPRRKSISEQYIYLIGDEVRISSLYSYMQNVSPESPRQGQIEIYNGSKRSQSLEFKFAEKSDFLTIDAPKNIAAGQSVKVNLTYAVSGYYGELNDLVDIYVDGKKSTMTLRTRGYAIDDFKNNSKKGGAIGQFSEKFINFALLKISAGDAVRQFSIENLGVETLYIRSIDAPKGVIITSNGAPLEGASVASAEMINVDVTLKGSELELGSYLRYVTIILNDSEQPVVRLKIAGEVTN